jgi:hypothetical protein
MRYKSKDWYLGGKNSEMVMIAMPEEIKDSIRRKSAEIKQSMSALCLEIVIKEIRKEDKELDEHLTALNR